MTISSIRILSAFALLFAPSVSRSASIIVPNSAEFAEGNGSQDFPFTPRDGALTRYQQVFSSTEFASLSGPILITAISLRPDTNQAPFATTLEGIQINLSTTSRTADTLSDLFATNVGNDDAIVFNGALPFASASTSAGAKPKDFDVVIPFADPFYYEPTAGSQLLEVRNTSGSESYLQMDSSADLADGVSRAYTKSTSPNSPLAEFRDTSGLIVSFSIELVPRLTIRSLGSSAVRCAWATNAHGYRLVYAESLPSNLWSLATNAPIIIGSEYVVDSATVSTQRFFRLRRP